MEGSVRLRAASFVLACAFCIGAPLNNDPGVSLSDEVAVLIDLSELPSQTQRYADLGEPALLGEQEKQVAALTKEFKGEDAMLDDLDREISASQHRVAQRDAAKSTRYENDKQVAADASEDARELLAKAGDAAAKADAASRKYAAMAPISNASEKEYEKEKRAHTEMRHKAQALAKASKEAYEAASDAVKKAKKAKSRVAYDEEEKAEAASIVERARRAHDSSAAKSSDDERPVLDKAKDAAMATEMKKTLLKELDSEGNLKREVVVKLDTGDNGSGEVKEVDEVRAEGDAAAADEKEGKGLESGFAEKLATVEAQEAHEKEELKEEMHKKEVLVKRLSTEDEEEVTVQRKLETERKARRADEAYEAKLKAKLDRRESQLEKAVSKNAKLKQEIKQDIQQGKAIDQDTQELSTAADSTRQARKKVVADTDKAKKSAAAVLAADATKAASSTASAAEIPEAQQQQPAHEQPDREQAPPIQAPKKATKPVAPATGFAIPGWKKELGETDALSASLREEARKIGTAALDAKLNRDMKHLAKDEKAVTAGASPHHTSSSYTSKAGHASPAGKSETTSASKEAETRSENSKDLLRELSEGEASLEKVEGDDAAQGDAELGEYLAHSKKAGGATHAAPKGKDAVVDTTVMDAKLDQDIKKNSRTEMSALLRAATATGNEDAPPAAFPALARLASNEAAAAAPAPEPSSSHLDPHKPNAAKDAAVAAPDPSAQLDPHKPKAANAVLKMKVELERKLVRDEKVLVKSMRKVKADKEKLKATGVALPPKATTVLPPKTMPSAEVHAAANVVKTKAPVGSPMHPKTATKEPASVSTSQVLKALDAQETNLDKVESADSVDGGEDGGRAQMSQMANYLNARPTTN
jgi:hypothetical protein